MSQESTLAQTRGLLLSDDMIFTSRITGVGRDLGFAIKSAGSVKQLLTLTQQSQPRCLIIDLQNPGLDIAEFVRSVRIAGAPGAPGPYLVGYGSHVDAATLKKAREAGFDVVLPRSKFVEDLPTALPGWFAGKPETA
jgi:CheY-like chemotaxis protein